MRSIWKGAITFGMVNIPAKLYSATEDDRIALHQYHNECGSRIQQPRFCPNCEKKLEQADITKGYEVGEGYVALSEADFQSLPLKSVKTIEVVDFINVGQVDDRAFDKAYFLAAEQVGTKAYTLFLEAMATAKVVAVAKLVYREKEHLAIIRPFNGVMLLQTLHYANELRDYKELIPQPQLALITDKERELALTLVKAMTVSNFDYPKYVNEYRIALEKLIEAKLSGQVLPVPEPGPVSVADVAEALIASLEMVGAKK